YPVLAGAQPQPNRQPIRAVASIPPVGMILRDVAGDGAEILVLLPPGASPHSFEPTPGLLRETARAEVFFLVGRGLDDWAAALVRSAAADVPLERLGEIALPGPEPEAPGHDHGHPPVGGAGPDGLDPHVWLDPQKAAAMAGRIGLVLGRLRPEQAKHFHARALDARRRYGELAERASARLAPVRPVPFVTTHGALSHLVARFELRQVGVLTPFPGREPSPRVLRKIIETIRETGARAVLAEPQTSPRFAEVIARETGIAVGFVDPLGGGEGAETYEALLREAAGAIADALGSDPETGDD
ncbi:MAG: hypothetical protein GF346_00245, partial [Candidatus Eisenbacteria bacterium]|nr:hypothetical protein [Candidatus Latescibacterota bacterium]MBD3300862.1 hypothetical protein [Candidatus Eisenbacteria bacterium]